MSMEFSPPMNRSAPLSHETMESMRKATQAQAYKEELERQMKEDQARKAAELKRRKEEEVSDPFPNKF